MTCDKVILDPEASAFKTNLEDRPGGKSLMEMARSGEVKNIVASRLDRLFRLVQDGTATVAELNQRGIAVHLADEGGCSINTSSAIGCLMFNIMLAFNQFTPHLTSERTSASLLHKSRKGERVGRHVQYGHKLSGSDVVPDEEEQGVIKVIQLLLSSGKDPEEIARSLNRAGVLFRGHVWRTTNVKSVVRRL
jgi:DNA invertase Pin-like site-specific DNA recombinase